jgi:hypothetical protein
MLDKAHKDMTAMECRGDVVCIEELDSTTKKCSDNEQTTCAVCGGIHRKRWPRMRQNAGIEKIPVQQFLQALCH